MNEKELTTSNKQLSEAMQNSNLSSGFDGLTPSALPTPFVKILEDLSPEVKENNPGYVKGARPGVMLWPDLRFTKESLVIFLKIEQRVVLWKPNRGGFVATYLITDPEWKKQVVREDGFKKFAADGSEFVETMVYYLVNMDSPTNDTTVNLTRRIAVLNLSSARLKYARKINQAIQNYTFNGQSATWLGVWKIKLSDAKTDKGDFRVIGTPEFIRQIEPEEIGNIVLPGQELCKSFDLVIHPDSDLTDGEGRF